MNLFKTEAWDDPALDMYNELKEKQKSFDFVVDDRNQIAAELSACKSVRGMLTEQRAELRRENEELKRRLEHAESVIKMAIEWMEDDGCDCGVDEVGTCSLCLSKEWLKKDDEEEQKIQGACVDKNWFKGGSGLEKDGVG